MTACCPCWHGHWASLWPRRPTKKEEIQILEGYARDLERELEEIKKDIERLKEE
jgi:hypothetical protein